MDYNKMQIEEAKKNYKNWLCDSCPNRIITMYEDDTPVSHTPYGWWTGFCTVNGKEISSSKNPPKTCSKLAKSKTLFE